MTSLAVTTVTVSGPRVSGKLDVRFGLDKEGNRRVKFGGDSRADDSNVVAINGVDYVVVGLAFIEHPRKGWMIDRNSAAHSMVRAGSYGKPTDQARNWLWDWGVVNAESVANGWLVDRWVDVWRTPATPDIAARREELEAELRDLRQYEMMLDVFAESTRFAVIPFTKPVSCSWRNGFRSGNGYDDSRHTGNAFGWVLILRGDQWVRVAVAVAKSSHDTSFTPAPIERVSFVHQPETDFDPPIQGWLLGRITPWNRNDDCRKQPERQ